MFPELVLTDSARQPFSAEARAALLSAERIAGRGGSEIVRAEHLLLALIDPPSVPLRLLFANLRVDLADVIVRLRAQIAPPGVAAVALVDIDGEVKHALKRAVQEADRTEDGTVDSRHLLLALLACPPTPATSLLQEAGITDRALRDQMTRRRPGPGTVTAPGEETDWRSLVHAIHVSPIFLAIAGVMLLSGALLVLYPNAGGTRVLIGAFIISGWAVQICVHEFSHAAAAYLGGDRGVAAQGYLTLDPRYYSHPLLTIALPLIFIMLGGLPLPGGAVMINHGALRSRRWGLAVSAAGPLGTLLCLGLLSLPFLCTPDSIVYGHAFFLFASISGLGQILAAVLILNLIPLPPLDGFHILAHWLPDEVSAAANRLGWTPMILLYLVLAHRSPITDTFWSLTFAICHLLHLPVNLGGYALWMIGF